jgi:hypothetical protein
MLEFFGMNRKGEPFKTCDRCREGKRRVGHTSRSRKTKQQYRQAKWWIQLIGRSKASDERKGIHIAEDYVDKEHLIYQREDQDNKCFYCHKTMVSSNPCDDDYQPMANNRLSIERMDNTLPHVKENIVLACWGCNWQRKDNYSFDEFYQMKIMERKIHDAQ